MATYAAILPSVKKDYTALLFTEGLRFLCVNQQLRYKQQDSGTVYSSVPTAISSHFFSISATSASCVRQRSKF